MTTPVDNICKGIGRLAVVGVAKNCGKTTTLNYLLRSEAVAERCVGLVSVGIDGESADLLIGTDKPSIRVREDSWVVTARGALENSSARLEHVASLGFSTPMGEVVVARVLEAGTVVLAGMRHRGDLVDACEVLEEHGVDLVLIDGAYGRTVAARADVSEGVVVSTGAVLSPNVDEIVAETASLIERLTTDPAEEGWQADLIEEAIRRERCLLGGPSIEPVELPSKSALVGLRRAENLWSDETRAVAVPGLVSDRVVEHLLGAPEHVSTLLVPDGTVIKASSRLFRRFERRFSVRAHRAIELRAVSVNPTGLQGHRVDRQALCELLEERWPNVPVFDPLHSERLAP